MKYLINLGDSITISLYPDLDAQERFGQVYKGLGAGDLLYKNHDGLFPEFKGMDLVSMYPGIKHFNMATDGGTIPSVYRQIDTALQRVDPDNEGVITLTVGGNDLLQLYAKSNTQEEMDSGVEKLMVQFEALVRHIKAIFPKAHVILNTVYDPTDGTGYFPGSSTKLPLDYLLNFNRSVEWLAQDFECGFVDVAADFMGRGVTTMSDDGGKTVQPNKGGYYWHHSIIEPSIYGANSLRAEWLLAIP